MYWSLMSLDFPSPPQEVFASTALSLSHSPKDCLRLQEVDGVGCRPLTPQVALASAQVRTVGTSFRPHGNGPTAASRPCDPLLLPSELPMGTLEGLTLVSQRPRLPW